MINEVSRATNSVEPHFLALGKFLIKTLFLSLSLSICFFKK